MSGTEVLVSEARQNAQQLRMSLTEAADQQIARAVAVVDRLADRGEADGLIAPLRPRLAVLRPSRPAGFARVLFSPLDPVIQAAKIWRRGAIGIPRTALAPMAAQVRRALHAEMEQIEEMLRENRPEATLLAGMRLWAPAAAVLRSSPLTPEWANATGLGKADHAAITSGCAAVLEQAADIETMLIDVSTQPGSQDGVLQRMFASAATQGPFEASLLLAVLIARVPGVNDVIAAAGEVARAYSDVSGRAAVDQAIEFQLDALEEAGQPDPNIERATTGARRVAALLNALGLPGASFRPSRKSRADALRHTIDGAYRARFAAELKQRLVFSPADLGAGVADERLLELENSVRALRRYEGAARKLGGGEYYDKLLLGAGSWARNLPLPLVDRARLVELMNGSDAAMSVLSGR